MIKIQHLPREEETMRDYMNERSRKALIFYLSVLPSSPPSLSGQLCKFLIFSFPPCMFFGYLGAHGSCLVSPRTYLICIHPLPDQTCHTATNYLIRAAPHHCSIPFPPLLHHNLRQHLFNSLFFCTIYSAKHV